jgi:hypothetical protein
LNLESLVEFWLLKASARRDRILITLPFYLLFITLLIRHEVWRDEINAFAISSVSHSIPEVLHRVQYEGHPALWYLILYAASRISSGIWMLKLVECLIATCTYFALAWLAPLRCLELLLVLSGYYLTYEYTVQARMYGLLFLFAIIYAWSRTRHPDRLLQNTILLGIIANVDIMGCILSGGLLIEFGLTFFARNSGKKAQKALVGLSIYCAMVAISLATLKPARDIGWSTTGQLFSHFWEQTQLVQAALKWIAIPWLPLSINMLFEWITTGWTYFFLAPFILLVLYIIFRPHWRQGTIIAAVIAVGILFSQITSVGATRHTGMVYIAFLVALWILRYQNLQVSPLAYVLLGFVSITGIVAVMDQFSWVYVDTGNAAAWIKQQHLENMPLLDTPDTDALGVPERLHRPVYQLACRCQDDVLTFSARRDDFKEERDIPSRIEEGFQKMQIPVGLLIITHPMNVVQINQLNAAHYRVDRIAQFDKGFVGEEYIFLYRISNLSFPLPIQGASVSAK